MGSGDIARRAAEAAVEELARDVVILDLRGRSDAVDYFVIASGMSDQHLHAMMTGIERALKQEGNRPDHREGQSGSKWVLLDYFDVVVHGFNPKTRDFYALEELWGDAPIERLENAADAPSGYDEDDSQHDSDY